MTRSWKGPALPCNKPQLEAEAGVFSERNQSALPSDHGSLPTTNNKKTYVSGSKNIPKLQYLVAE